MRVDGATLPSLKVIDLGRYRILVLSEPPFPLVEIMKDSLHGSAGKDSLRLPHWDRPHPQLPPLPFLDLAMGTHLIEGKHQPQPRNDPVAKKGKGHLISLLCCTHPH